MPKLEVPTGYTPGPWQAAPGLVYDVRDADVILLAGTYDNPDAPRRTADAALIALAPALAARVEELEAALRDAEALLAVLLARVSPADTAHEELREIRVVLGEG